MRANRKKEILDSLLNYNFSVFKIPSVKELISDKSKITEFLNRKSIKHEEKDKIYSVSIDEALKDEIMDNINNYITLKSVDDKSEEGISIFFPL